MSTLSKLVILFTLALSASSMAMPHSGRGLNAHHGLAARNASPQPAPAPAVGPYGDLNVVKPKKLTRRSDSSRCSAKSSSAVLSSTSSLIPVATSTSAAIAVEAAPSSSSSSTRSSSSETSTSKVKATSSSTSAPTPTFEIQSTSSTSTDAPQSTTTQSTKATSSTAASTSTTASSSSTESYLTGTQTGEGTFYAIGLGACGVTNSGDDKIVAVSHLIFDSFPNYNGVNPNSNPVCGKSITATYNGKSTTVTVQDRCTGCALTDLDFSPSAFQNLADESVGRLFGMTWVWNN